MHFRWNALVLGAVIALTVCGCMQARYDSPSNPHLVLDEIRPDAAGSGAAEGHWSAPVLTSGSNDDAHGTGIESHNGVRTVTLWGEPRDVNWPAGNGPVHFVIQRPAGSITFDGMRNGGQASGTWRFEPERAFVDEMSKLFGTPPKADHLFDLALNGFDPAYARALYAAGYRFSLEDVQSLQRYGIAVAYAVDLRDAGYTLDAHDIIMLHNYGVSASYTRQLRAGGFELTAQDQVTLHNSGVDAPYAVAARKLGIADGVSQIVQLHNAGISMDYVAELAAAGYRFGALDVVRLHNSGVAASYAASLRKGGYELSADDLIRLHNGGIDPSYAVALVVPSHSNLPVEEIIRLRNHGLDAETIRRLRE